MQIADSDLEIELLGDAPERSLGRRLARDLADARSMSIAVAFAKRSALSRLDLVDWCSEGRGLRLVAGTDFALTELELLTTLGGRPNTQCRVFHMAQVQRSFHPKLYVLERPGSRVAYVGSANLTGGGLGDNFESVVRIEGPSDHPRLDDAERMFDGFFDSEFATPVTEDFARRYAELQQAHRDARVERYRVPEVDRFIAEDRLSLAEYRATLPGKRWLLVTTASNYAICMRHRTWGFQHERQIRECQAGGVFFIHVTKGRGLSALGMFTGAPFYDDSPLWPSDGRGNFPWRIRFVVIGELRQGLPTGDLLRPLRADPKGNWLQGFVVASHTIDQPDYDALARAFRAALREEMRKDEQIH